MDEKAFFTKLVDNSKDETIFKEDELKRRGEMENSNGNGSRRMDKMSKTA
jgi:hypothetical protein